MHGCPHRCQAVAVAFLAAWSLAAAVPCQPGFVERMYAHLPSGGTFGGFAHGDIDGDGDRDLIAMFLDTAHRVRNLGHGRFILDGTIGPQQQFRTTPRLADLNGDGNLDLIVSSSLFANDGSGNFTDVTAASLAPGLTLCSAPVPADVDGDGDTDLLCVAPAGTLQTLLNDGTGLFSLGSTAATSVNGITLAVDADGDGDPDVLCSTSGAYVNSVWLENTGGGVFSLASSLSVAPTDAYADFDSDGDLDWLATGRTGNSLLLHSAGFRWSFAGAVGSAGVARSLAADCDGDGDVDLVLDAGGPEVWLNDGAAQFTRAPASMPPWIDSAAPQAFDADADGDLDFVEFGAPWRILFNEGGLQWRDGSAGPFPRPAMAFVDWAVGDLDGDGLDDVVVANDSISFAGGEPELFLNSGFGSFRHLPPIASPGQSGAILIADVDGDGDGDLLDGHYSELRVFLNDGRAGFTQRAGYPRGMAITLAAGDLAGNAAVDVLMCRQTNPGLYPGRYALDLLVNDGAGGFTCSSTYPNSSSEIDAFGVLDFDGDGDLDTVHARGSRMEVFRNDGAGVFTMIMQNAPFHGTDLEIADFDGDGDLDIMTAARLSAATAATNSDAALAGAAWKVQHIRRRAEPRGTVSPSLRRRGAVAMAAASPRKCCRSSKI